MSRRRRNGKDDFLYFLIFLISPYIAIFFILKYLFIGLVCLIKFIINLFSKSNRKTKKLDYDKNNEKKYSYSQPEGNLTENKVEIQKYTLKNSLVTDCEMYFYKILENNFSAKYKIQTQVNLASIINKEIDNKFINELFRNIDFGIFDKETLKPLLLIEINDSTHKNPDRYERDLKVRKILEESKIKLITFYTSYENKENYVTNRIIKSLPEQITTQ